MAILNGKATELPAAVAGWLETLDGLVGDVRSWAGEAGWQARLAGVDLTERESGRYEAPVLVLTRGEVVVSLVPIARQVDGANGRVDLYLMPDFDGVASLFLEDSGRWLLHYAGRPDPMAIRSASEADRVNLDQAHLNRVLNDIAAHA